MFVGIKRNNVLNLLRGPLVERWQGHLGFPRVRAVNRLALVAKCFLGEPFWIPAASRPLCPGITIRMKRDASDARSAAAAFEFCRPVRFPQLAKIRKEWSRLGQGLQQSRKLIVKPNQRHGFRLFAEEAHYPIRPVNIFGGESGHIGLRRSKVPANLVERAALRIGFRGDDSPVLFLGNAPFFAVFDLGPASFGEDGPRQPVHVQSEIMQFAQMNIGGDRPLPQHVQEMLGAGFEKAPVTEQGERLVLEGPVPADARGVLLGQHDFVHHRLPGALADFRVARRQVRPGDLKVQDGLLAGFVSGVEQAERGGLVLRAKGCLLAGFTVVAPKIIPAAKHAESRFHTLQLSFVA